MTYKVFFWFWYAALIKSPALFFWRLKNAYVFKITLLLFFNSATVSDSYTIKQMVMQINNAAWRWQSSFTDWMLLFLSITTPACITDVVITWSGTTSAAGSHRGEHLLTCARQGASICRLQSQWVKKKLEACLNSFHKGHHIYSSHIYMII